MMLLFSKQKQRLSCLVGVALLFWFINTALFASWYNQRGKLHNGIFHANDDNDKPQVLQQQQQQQAQGISIETTPPAVVTNTTRAISIQDNDTILPLWQCHEQKKQKQQRKLVFVHIFKTAGSSFRQFLDDYAVQCHKGLAVLMRCSTVAPPRDLDEAWESANHQRCVNEFSRSRRQSKKINLYGPVTGRFLRDAADIVIGHLPIGIHEHWQNTTITGTNSPQYVTFFRDPVAKYVSGRLYVNQDKHWTFQQAVTNIKAQVMAARQIEGSSSSSSSYYFGVEKYLTTPTQQVSRGKKSLPERAELVQQNLLNYHCFVGIVERMGDSLALLQHVLDSDGQLTHMFGRLDTSTKGNTQQSHHVMTIVNQSELSTKDIVTELKKDEPFYSILLEYLKYEFLVYNFALETHNRQVRALNGRHSSRFQLD